MAGSEREPHDYERGDVRHPMHTEPMCLVCGNPPYHWLHDIDRVLKWERIMTWDVKEKHDG